MCRKYIGPQINLEHLLLNINIQENISICVEDTSDLKLILNLLPQIKLIFNWSILIQLVESTVELIKKYEIVNNTKPISFNVHITA